MKLISTILFTLFTLIMNGCLLTKKSQNAIQSTTPVIRLKVSFISIGQGINFEATKYFPKVIEEFNKKHKVKLSYELIPWGREGEFNYCFKEQKKIDEFIIYAKKEMSKYENVEFHENPLNCDR